MNYYSLLSEPLVNAYAAWLGRFVPAARRLFDTKHLACCSTLFLVLWNKDLRSTYYLRS